MLQLEYDKDILFNCNLYLIYTVYITETRRMKKYYFGMRMI